MCLIVWAQSIDLLVPPSCFSDRWKESGGECNHRCRRPADCTGKLTTWHGSTMRAFQTSYNLWRNAKVNFANWFICLQNHFKKINDSINAQMYCSLIICTSVCLINQCWSILAFEYQQNCIESSFTAKYTVKCFTKKNKKHRKMIDVKLLLVIAKVKKGPFITNEK